MPRGEVRFRLVLDSKQFESGVKVAQREFEGFIKQLGNGAGVLGKTALAMGPVGMAAAAAMGAATAAVAGFVKVTTDAVQKVAAYADQLDALAVRTGLSTDALQDLGVAAKLGNSSIEGVAGAVNKMQKALNDGDPAFRKLGLNVEQLKKQNPEQQFMAVARAIESLSTPTERAAARMDIFGKSGNELAGTLKAAAQGAGELGGKLSGEALDAAAAFQDKADLLAIAWDRVVMQFGAAVAASPELQQALTDTTDLLVRAAETIARWAGKISGFFNTIISGARLLPPALKQFFGFNGNSIEAHGAESRPWEIGPKQPAGRYAGKADEEAIKAAAKVQKAWQDAAEAARVAWDKFRLDLFKLGQEAMGGMQADLSKFVKALVGSPQEAFDQMRRMLSKSMGGSGRLLSEETGGEGMQFFSRDKKIQKELQRSGGHLFPVKETQDWTQALENAANQLRLFGGAGGLLASFAGSIAAIGANIKQMKSAGGGLSGILGKIGGGLGIAGAAIGVFQGLKGLFGGGPSKAERAAAAKQAAEEAAAAAKRVQDAAKAQRAAGIEGLLGVGSQFFMQRTILNAEDAKQQGALFAAAWGQVVKEKGIVAAADAFKDAFAKMKKDIEAVGLDKPAWFTDIENLIDVGLDEEFRHIAEAAKTAADFLKAMAESGIIGPEAFAAFEQEVRKAFEGGKQRAIELGKDEATAIKVGFGAANPLLKELLNQSILSRTALSEDIQAMVEAAGIVPDVEFQQLDELRNIRDAVNALAGIVDDAGGPPPADVTGHPPDGNPPRLASGGYVRKSGLAYLDAGEFVGGGPAGGPIPFDPGDSGGVTGGPAGPIVPFDPGDSGGGVLGGPAGGPAAFARTIAQEVAKASRPPINIQQGSVVISGAGNATEIIRTVIAAMRNNTEGTASVVREVARSGARF